MLRDKKYRINGIEGDELEGVVNAMLQPGACNCLEEICLAVLHKTSPPGRIEVMPDIMTPRDIFAAHAMGGMMGGFILNPTTSINTEALANGAYKAADAMLEARGEGKVCEWKNCGEYWTTGCHNGTSKHQSDMHYCPYCGKKIKEVEP